MAGPLIGTGAPGGNKRGKVSRGRSTLAVSTRHGGRTGRGCEATSVTEEEAAVQGDGVAAWDHTTFQDGSRVGMASFHFSYFCISR